MQLLQLKTRKFLANYDGIKSDLPLKVQIQCSKAPEYTDVGILESLLTIRVVKTVHGSEYSMIELQCKAQLQDTKDYSGDTIDEIAQLVVPQMAQRINDALIALGFKGISILPENYSAREHRVH